MAESGETYDLVEARADAASGAAMLARDKIE